MIAFAGDLDSRVDVVEAQHAAEAQETIVEKVEREFIVKVTCRSQTREELKLLGAVILCRNRGIIK
jgi:hypothetical protein